MRNQLLTLLLPVLLLAGLNGCASMLYRHRGFSPVSVQTTGPLLAETTGNYNLRSGVGLSVLLCGGKTGVVVRQRDQPGEAPLTVAAVPRFLGHWSISPFFPIPLIPLFGFPRQPPQTEVVFLAWGHPTVGVEIDVEETWIQVDGADAETRLSRVVGVFERDEIKPSEGSTTIRVPHFTESTRLTEGPGPVALIFDVSPQSVERISANVAIVLESGEVGSIRIELRKKSSLAYDPLGMNIGWQKFYDPGDR
jgi:hypothetical protein